MRVEQLYTKCLAEAAYFIESEGQIAVIDPLREVQPYLDLATEWGGKIIYIFETHFHADFVSGHIDLAKKTGAPIVYGPDSHPSFECIVAADNQEFKIGKVTIKVLHTPGHTPESVTYLLLDENGKEHAIFTGDTLFLGDVGRPDLAIKGDLTQEDLAGMLYDSLRNKIMQLPDEVIVYPGHGAGSSCGKNMSSETVGTLGEQKRTNYALRTDVSKADFIKELTEGILPPPQYFPKNAMMNKTGYDSFDAVVDRGTQGLSVAEVKAAQANGALILDVRTQNDYMNGFIAGSQFIGLNGTFAMWVGALIENIKQPIVLVAPEGQEEEAVTRLARVGYDHCIGYLDGGMNAWKAAGEEVQTITSVDAESLEKVFDTISLVDVRKPGEWDAEHVDGATHYALDFMQDDLTKLDKNKTYHIHCAGGYRSVIAISLLMRNGYTNLIDVAGGFGAIKKTRLPVTDFVCSSTK
ncbi:MAG: MBL fold metallo-hydrolase [Candidatus Fluviicola riflensis]|nr:MAG: MBL fold metallo-hydrolase [Candidatus Fluviicola riflensis]OGS78484.1 MAG: MBL fold metallo-hydrolase [Candidatus Fluviicola riflensis]OGS85550.1 MAG: MBL fold metallo-hydrolase [Fluviicola sp. RIFCSPHIGHO2_01_FULL_43_53]OGS87591.1 MAG: MBL fold metallo-hydrolase [Fluviicola sp. RIFCSPHIGHO2_12_FULL_43_24]